MEKSTKLKLKENKEETPSSKIFWAFMYLLLIIVVLFSACFIYDRTYYTPFYVVGKSMQPTLNNQEVYDQGYYEYGIVDEHRMTLKSLKRYDLIITYYTNDYEEEENIAPARFLPVHAANNLKPDSGAKIKRIIGMPNETVTITNKDKDSNLDNVNRIYITKDVVSKSGEIQTVTEKLDLPFTPLDENGLAYAIAKHNGKDSATPDDVMSVTLNDGEYFVMGDNWGHSDDSTSSDVGPIKKEFILGCVIKIQGKVKLYNGQVEQRVEYKHDEIRYYKQ